MSNYQAQLFQDIWNSIDTQAQDAGITIYRQNLLMNAERALSITYPTVVELVGEEFFSLIVRDFINYEKLSGGDWGEWGESLPDWLAENESLASFPFICDCAKLDWLCHQAERDAEVHSKTATHIPTDTDLTQLSIQYCAGANVLQSNYPLVDIKRGHQATDDHDRHYYLRHAKDKISQGIGQNALVWRPQWQSLVRDVNSDESDWLTITLNGGSISEALDKVSTTFNFETWLNQSIQDGLVKGFYKETKK